MDNYIKGESRFVDEKPSRHEELDANVVHMKVNHGSKIRNVMEFALKKMESGVDQVTWNASGPAVSKAVSCAEIMKRKIKSLHQNTKIYFKREETYWEPQMQGLDRLCVTKNVPAISILLSKRELDSSEPGYQPPGSFEAFWKKSIISEQTKKSDRHKKPGPNSKRPSEDSSRFAPPSMRRKPKKRREGEAAARGAKTATGTEHKEMKTAKNDSVKAQDRKKRQVQQTDTQNEGSEEASATSPSDGASAVDETMDTH